MPLPSADLLAGPSPRVASLLGDFTADRRLYDLEAEGELGTMWVESWSLDEALNEPWVLRLDLLHLRPDLDLQAMLGRRLALLTTLADGRRLPRAGVVTDAAASESDGGLCRYALTVQPWLALLGYTRRSQLWQDCSLVQIVESLFDGYRPEAAWRWAADTAGHLALSPRADDQGRRGTTTQYRETDLAFFHRLIAEEGLVYRFESDPGAPLGHRLVLLADTPRTASCPADPTSAAGLDGLPGVRFHRASSVEPQDTVQAFGAQRRLPSASTTVLAWDAGTKRAIAASVPTVAAFGGPNAPRLEHYDAVRPGAYADRARAERAALLRQQACEGRHKGWQGRSTVRTFATGTTFRLTQSVLDPIEAIEDPADPVAHDPAHDGRTTFLLLRIAHAGANNLPTEIRQRLAAGRPGSGELPGDGPDAGMLAQARASGYANRFEATRAQVPWRPAAADGAWRPTAAGPQTATVVGLAGEREPRGADEICTDAVGRIRVQFHFQHPAFDPAGPRSNPASSRISAWVRVMQRHAGSGMGLQLIPRIGQEVLVDFLEGDVDCPIVVAALHDGRGEAGVPPTPGGRPAGAELGALRHGTDAAPSAQGNLAGGRSPAWHGAGAGELAAGGQRNAGALSGFKTKEFGGPGFNQLVFDDSDRQLRTQLATTQHATQLNLGHLVHQADNHRGSFRGLGFELRTDAYGAIRAGGGLLLTSYGIAPGEPAGDNAAGVALVRQFAQLGERFDAAARAHRTVPIAASSASSSAASAEAALPALRTALLGTVDAGSLAGAEADVDARNTATGDGRLPQTTAPVVAISARAGLAVSAGADLQIVAGDGIVLGAGRDAASVSGGPTRIHAGQAIGLLGGATGPGEATAGTGLTIVAGGGDVELAAQAGRLGIAARDEVAIASRSTRIEAAAAKRITLSTAAGANITIEGGNLTVQCPGTLRIRAATRSFVGPATTDHPLPGVPGQVCLACLLKARKSGARVAIA